MSEPKAIQAYLETVAAQIRWKRARAVILPELAQHLEDQRDAFAAEGCEHPEQLAVEEMGDPVPVGIELDRLHRPRAQWGLLCLAMAFALLGTLLRVWLTQEFAHPSVLYRTAIALILGYGALLLGYFFDCTYLARHGRSLYVLTLGVSLLVLFTSPIINGVSYYTRYVILGYPVIYALWLYSWRRYGWVGLIASLAGGIPLGLLCLMVPDQFGLLLLSMGMLVLTLWAAWNDWFGIGKGKSAAFVLSCALLAAGAALRYALSSPYLMQKFTAVFHPEQAPEGRGYGALAIRTILDASQWMGTGTWNENGTPLEQTLPGYDGEAFLTTLIHQIGWLPFLLVLCVFAVLILWLFCRCLRQKSYLGKWVVIAVVLTLSVQACCSVLWSLGFPVLDAAFPLVIGNLNTVIDLWLIGLALSVFREERILRDLPCAPKLPLPRYRLTITLQKISE